MYSPPVWLTIPHRSGRCLIPVAALWTFISCVTLSYTIPIRVSLANLLSLFGLFILAIPSKSQGFKSGL